MTSNRAPAATPSRVSSNVAIRTFAVLATQNDDIDVDVDSSSTPNPRAIERDAMANPINDDTASSSSAAPSRGNARKSFSCIAPSRTGSMASSYANSTTPLGGVGGASAVMHARL